MLLKDCLMYIEYDSKNSFCWYFFYELFVLLRFWSVYSMGNYVRNI